MQLCQISLIYCHFSLILCQLIINYFWILLKKGWFHHSENLKWLHFILLQIWSFWNTLGLRDAQMYTWKSHQYKQLKWCSHCWFNCHSVLRRNWCVLYLLSQQSSSPSHLPVKLRHLLQLEWKSLLKHIDSSHFV